jgi:potassium-transporting ATPase potassium-binding subunit
MNFYCYAQYAVFLSVVLLLVKPAGAYMARVFSGERTRLDPILGPLERAFYRLCGVNPKQDMTWREYAGAFILFSAVGTLFLYAILRLQNHLPTADPVHLTTPLTPDLAANTALSFSTTTTWQAYGGENTMSYFSQMVGLCAQNFMAGAAGLAVGIAFIRGLAREKTGRIGNFWVDLTRSLLWVLLPLSLVGALILVWQGVPCNFAPYIVVTTLEGAQQTLAQGPVAPLEIIKNLGTNGGGFFNANGAHPFENPTPLTNLIEMLAIAVLPAALTYTFGRMTGYMRQGWTLLWVMVALFVGGLVVCDRAEQGGVPAQSAAGHIAIAPSFTQPAFTQPAFTQPGGNMEGKETRFGIGSSVLTAINTSNTATGSTNSSQDSYTPIGGLVPLVNMLLGEIVFGGLGTGLYSMVLTALIGVFITGLMIGRTPEYLGKQLGPPEIKLITLYTLAGPATVLMLTAIAVIAPQGLAGLTTNGGAHGLTEILYAYTSSFANNGQAFAGLNANTPFYNITIMVAMMMGRFFLAIPALALAGKFAQQRRRAITLATLPTDTPLFASVIVGTALIITGLSFLPALALGPLVEHCLMNR